MNRPQSRNYNNCQFFTLQPVSILITFTYPMVLAAAACCTNTGKGAFILGTSGSIKNEKSTKLFTDLNYS